MEIATQLSSLSAMKARALNLGSRKHAQFSKPSSECSLRSAIRIFFISLAIEESETFSIRRIDKSLYRSGLTAEMVTSFSPPSVSVIFTMDSKTFSNVFIVEISELLGIKSVFLISIKVSTQCLMLLKQTFHHIIGRVPSSSYVLLVC